MNTVTSVAGKTGTVVLTSSDVGLGSANNTADADKPISSAAATALAGKAPLTGSGTSGTWPISISGTADTVTTNANLTGDVTSLGNVATIPDASVLGRILTGFTTGAGTVAVTDSILTALQKLNGNDALKAPIVSPSFIGIVNAPVVILNSKSVTSAASVSTASTAATTLVSVVATALSTMKLLIMAMSGSNRQVTELLLLTDGTVANATEYGTVVIGTNVFSVDVAVTGGNLLVVVTSATATATNYVANYVYL